MKSVTIKDLKTGDLLIKVYKTKGGYEAMVRDDLSPMDIVIRNDKNQVTKIKFKPEKLRTA